MNGLIINHRRGKSAQRINQYLMVIEGINNRTTASKLIGKTVSWKTTKKDIHGKITSLHGSNGVMIVRFSNNMSGNLLGQRVEVLE